MGDHSIPAGLSSALATVNDTKASAEQLRAAAEQARATGRAIDETLAAAPQRRVDALAHVKPRLADPFAALAALDGNEREYAWSRRFRAAISQLDAKGARGREG